MPAGNCVMEASLFLLGCCAALAQGAGYSQERIISVEGGQKRFELSDGQSGRWHYIQMRVPSAQCVAAVHVDALQTLNAADDVQIVYKSCDGQQQGDDDDRGGWLVRHYRHSGNLFTLHQPIRATQVALVSVSNLHIVDMTLIQCSEMEAVTTPVLSCVAAAAVPSASTATTTSSTTSTTTTTQVVTTTTAVSRAASPSPVYSGVRHARRRHGHRHQRLTRQDRQAIVADVLHKLADMIDTDVPHQRFRRDSQLPKLRRKRQILGGRLSRDLTLPATQQPHLVSNDLLVPQGSTLTIDPGARLNFKPGTGVTVQGRLVARGTRLRPIHLSAEQPDRPWTGITFEQRFTTLDVRLSGSGVGNDGAVAVYNGSSWVHVCATRWTLKSANVFCRQLGFTLGATTIKSNGGQTDASQYEYWSAAPDCRGDETELRACATQSVDDCATAAYVACQGTPIAGRSLSESAFEFINMTDTLTGVTSRGHQVPRMKHVISQRSADNGFTITLYFEPSSIPLQNEIVLEGLRAAYCAGNGIQLNLDYPSQATALSIQPQLIIGDTISAHNQRNGIRINGNGMLILNEVSVFMNTRDGINSQLTAGSLHLVRLLIASNSQHAVQFVRSSLERVPVSLMMSDCNVTGHWWGAAVTVDAHHNTSVLIRRSNLWDNYNGVIQLAPSGTEGSTFRVLNNNITLNRGTVVEMNKLGGENTVDIMENQFSLNLLTDHTEQEAVIDINFATSLLPSRLVIAKNQFYKNTMQAVLVLSDRFGYTEHDVSVLENEIIANNVPNAVTVNLNRAQVYHNVLHNAVSTCELRTGRGQGQINATLNYWHFDKPQEISARVCDGHREADLIKAETVPFLTERPNRQTTSTDQPTVDSQQLGGVVQAQSLVFSPDKQPYTVNEPFIIDSDSTLVIEPGTTLLILTGAGVEVKGRLIARGTAQNPIQFIGFNGANWNGVTMNGASGQSVLEHVNIDGALDGLIINTPNIVLTSVNINRSVRTAVFIGPSSGQTVDFGQSRLTQSLADAITVAPRSQPLSIENANIDSPAKSGINFEGATGSVYIADVKIEDAGEYGIIVGHQPEQVPRVHVHRTSISRQTNGLAGLVIRLKHHTDVSVTNSTFELNDNPSVEVQLQCSLAQPTIPEFTFAHNTVRDNRNTVVAVSLLNCARADITHNKIQHNNVDAKYGAFKIVTQPAIGQAKRFLITVSSNEFTGNGGDYSLYLQPMNMQPFQGKVVGNKFKLNSNKQTTLLVGSPTYDVNSNVFDNPESRYELEVEYNDDVTLDATENFWNRSTASQILDRIRDRSEIGVRGSVLYVPFLTDEDGSSTSGGLAPDLCQSFGGCGNRGTCNAAGRCECEPGFTGGRCSQPLIDDCDCSGNGQCLANGQCRCFQGWSGASCSIPLCSGVNDCSGNGRCVSRDECTCDAGFTAFDCSLPLCRDCGAHGRCATDGSERCICEPGWTGLTCGTIVKPICNGNCSNAGECVAPGRCLCDPGRTGSDCSSCVNCEQSDTCSRGCVHGTCTRGNCVCNSGFKGVDCSQCSASDISVCNEAEEVTYVLPANVQLNGRPTPITFNIHGINFQPPVTNKRYSCVLNNETYVAEWLSETHLQCQDVIVSEGKHAFSLVDSQANLVPFTAGVQAHVHGFNGCDLGTCSAHGTCIQGWCVCEQYFTESTCSVLISNKPEINWRDISQIATEGVPYTARLTTVQTDLDGVFWTLNEGPPNMRIVHDTTTSSHLIWPSPIGSLDPVNVKVLVESSTGNSSASWQLSVPRTYRVVIDPITAQQNTVSPNKPFKIKGQIEFDPGAVALPSVPVHVRVYADGDLEWATTITAHNATFDNHITLPNNIGSSGNAVLVATHPGTPVFPFDLETAGRIDIQLTILELQLEEQVFDMPATGSRINVDVPYIITNIGSTSFSDLRFSVRRVFHHRSQSHLAISSSTALTVNNQAYFGEAMSLTTGQKYNVNVKIRLTDVGPEIIQLEYMIAAESAEYDIQKQQIVTLKRDLNTYRLVAEPAELKFDIIDGMAPPLTEVTIRNVGTRLTGSLRVPISPDKEVFVVSNPDPLEPDGYTSLVLGVLPAARAITNDEIQITTTTSQVLLRIPYSIRRKSGFNVTDVQVFVQDELSNDLVKGVEVTLSNPATAFGDTQFTSSERDALVFRSVPSGQYNMCLSSPRHHHTCTSVHINPFNSQFNVDLQLITVDERVVAGLNSSSNEYMVAAHWSPVEELKDMLPLVHSAKSTATPVVNGVITVQLTNAGSKGVFVRPFNIKHSHLPFELRHEVTHYLSGGSSISVPLKLKKFKQETSCHYYLIPVPYFFENDDGFFIERQSSILLNYKEHTSDVPTVCKLAVKGDGSSDLSPVPIWLESVLPCNCQPYYKAQCASTYVPLVPCSHQVQQAVDAPLYIPFLSAFTDLIIGCAHRGANWKHISAAISCHLRMTEVCPSNQIGLSDALNTMQEFMQHALVAIMPFSWDQLPNAAWLSEFQSVVSYSSRSGPLITQRELDNNAHLKSNNSTIQFARNWNVVAQADKDPLFERTVRLKAFLQKLQGQAEKKGARRITSYLDSLMLGGEAAAASDSDVDVVCANINSSVQPSNQWIENQKFTITLITSAGSRTLTRFGLLLNFVDASDYQADIRNVILEPPRYSGISSLNGLYSLNAGSRMQVEWTGSVRNITSSNRIVPIVQISYVLSGDRSLLPQRQKIALSAPITISAEPKLTVITAVVPLIQPKSYGGESEAFSIAVGLINKGTQTARRISFNQFFIDVRQATSTARPIKYTVDSWRFHPEFMNAEEPAVKSSWQRRQFDIKPNSTVFLLLNVSIPTPGIIGQIEGLAVWPLIGDKALVASNQLGLLKVIAELDSSTYVVEEARSSSLFDAKRHLLDLSSGSSTELPEAIYRGTLLDTQGDGARLLVVEFQAPQRPPSVPIFTGSFPATVNAGQNLKLISATATLGGATVTKDPGRFWQDANNPRLWHFVDEEFALGAPEFGNRTYTLRFGERSALTPVFGQAQYVAVPISPNAILHSVVAQVSASSEGTAEITYELFGGNGVFAVERNTGTVRLAKRPPADWAPHHCLTIRATTNDAPPLRLHATLNILTLRKSSISFSSVATLLVSVIPVSQSAAPDCEPMSAEAMATATAYVYAESDAGSSTSQPQTSTYSSTAASTDTATTDQTDLCNVFDCETTSRRPSPSIDPNLDGSAATAVITFSTASPISLRTTPTKKPLVVDVDEVNERKLVALACKFRDQKPIWGVICDLSKTVDYKRD